MKKLIAVILLAAGSMFGQVSFGIRLGQPPAPRVERVRPRAPGPDYIWVDGYWIPQGNRYSWHDGYWTRPPYEGSAWTDPRYEGGMYYEGYWNGSRNEHFDRAGDPVDRPLTSTSENRAARARCTRRFRRRSKG